MRAVGLVVALLLAAALAGCGSKPPPMSTSPTQTATGRIDGRVIDDSQAAIVGADVRVLLTNLSARTDDAGSFVFERVPAGPVRVVASATDHTSQTRSAVLEGNGRLRLEFVLTTVQTVEPFTEPKTFSGTIVCGLPQGVACPSDPSAPTEDPEPYRYEVLPGLAGIVFELEWTPPASGVNEQLAFDVQAASASGCGARYAGAVGQSVLKLVVLDGFPISGGHQCVLVFPPTDGATTQQEFTMHITLFYHEPPPEDFTALAA